MTPGFIRTAACAVIAALSLTFAPGALAADEIGDAGDLRVTANDMGDSAVTQINGSFTGAMDSDLYRICLSNGFSFSASSVGQTFPPNLDTQLFLFDSQGYGIYANDDADGGIRGSTLPAQHRFSPSAGGEYFLAISQYNRDPQSSQGEIFQDNFSEWMFPDGVLFANGFGAGETLSGWDGRAPGGEGTYRITLTGTAPCVPPDTTFPTVDLRSPADGARVAQGAEVVVDFDCADEGSSGLASCVGTTADGALLDTRTLGDVPVTVTARDHAGNETVVTHTVTVVDEIDPTVDLRSPADGARVAQGADVVVDFDCADEGGSGLASCAGTTADGALLDTSTLGDVSVTVTASDHAGNETVVTHTVTVVDETDPQATIDSPQDGAEYERGAHVAADYSCADEPERLRHRVVRGRRGGRRRHRHEHARRPRLHRSGHGPGREHRFEDRQLHRG